MKYVLDGLNCSNCAGKIERRINEIPELKGVKINLATMSLQLEPSFEDQVQKIVDSVEPGVVLKTMEKAPLKWERSDVLKVKNNILRIAFSGLLWGTAIISHHTMPSYLNYSFYLLAYLIVGYPVLLRAFNNIRQGQVFDENFLMSIATLGALAINAKGEAIGVMLFYAIGQMLQELAVGRSRRSISELMDLRPDYANLWQDNKSIRVDPTELRVGQIIELRPGERVPVDGTIVFGSSYLDTSALTGESKPRRVEVGQEILSGSINSSGLLRVQVDKEYGESSVAKILELVENAAGKKAPAELFITGLAGRYTQVVVFAALLTAFLPPLLIPEAQLVTWVYRALILLVISCPCALVISIPLGYFAGIGTTSSAGVLVKGANILDHLVQVHTVVFDKTGTLTRGVFEVLEIQPYHHFTEREVLEWAALGEIHSHHPIAASIRSAWDGELDASVVEHYEEQKGLGIKARIKGKWILLGNIKCLQREGVEIVSGIIEGPRVHLAVDGIHAGSLLISDEIKEDSAQAIKQLKQLGVKEVIMLSGDDTKAAARVGAEIGVEQIYAQLLPQDKVAKMAEFKSSIPSQQGQLVFVGDGINDAPVLAQSDIGVAMGALGSDAAIEAADVVIMDDHLSKLPGAIKVARFTRKIIRQNIGLTLAIKFAVVILGLLGMATMWEAVFADVGAALLAILNSVRTLGVGKEIAA